MTSPDSIFYAERRTCYIGAEGSPSDYLVDKVTCSALSDAPVHCCGSVTSPDSIFYAERRTCSYRCGGLSERLFGG